VANRKDNDRFIDAGNGTKLVKPRTIGLLTRCLHLSQNFNNP